MIAAQNVMTTETMLHMASIGVGGLTRPPIVTKHTAATTTPTASVVRVSTRPLAGCGLAATNPGFAPHMTATTICIGMTQSRK